MRFAQLFAALVLLSVAFASIYVQEDTVDGWLKVTRSVDVSESSICAINGVSNICANTGGFQTGTNRSLVHSTVTLTATNIGPIDRENIVLSESLAFLPEAAKLEFSPNATHIASRQAIWELGNISAGNTKNVSYSVSARLTQGMVDRIPDILVKAKPVNAVLYAPSSMTEGERGAVTLKTSGGKALSGTIVNVVYPNGKSLAIKTDSDGKAAFFLPYAGEYTYYVDSYILSNPPSTIAKAKEQLPVVVAAAADSGIVGAMLGAIPTFAAIFAVLAVVMIAYNFVRSRREEEEAYFEAPSQGAAQDASGGFTYTQKFSFAENPSPEDRQIEEKTRDIIGSRKRQMHPAEDTSSIQAREAEETESTSQFSESAKMGQFAASGEEETGETAGSEEETEEYEDVEAQLAKLEEKARAGGESAGEGRDIDAIIAELEEIRNKLREGRDADSEGAEIYSADSDKDNDSDSEGEADVESPSDKGEAEEVSEEESEPAEAESEEAPGESWKEETKKPASRKKNAKPAPRKKAKPAKKKR